MRIKTEIPLTLSMIGSLFGHEITSDTEINFITTDSRIAEKNDLFIALRGEKFDAHSFIDDVKRKNAIVISESDSGDIKVKNTYSALLMIAELYKSFVSPKYTVAVTGSCGKTTVKDFIYKILSSEFKAHKTQNNYNNAVGLAHTLLTIPKSTSHLICEIGMNHKGEISELSRALRPDVSVITNVGTAHIGNLGSREEIAKAKMEIEDGMTYGKTVIFKEEPLLSHVKKPYFVSYEDKSADLYARILSRNHDGSKLYIKTKADEFCVATQLSSSHTLDSLILSIAASDAIGVNPEVIQNAAAAISESDLRQKFMLLGGYRIYNDSYNSSPDAVISALRMLSEREDKISVLLGDMLELGEKSIELHRYVGEECAKFNVKKVYAFGPLAVEIAHGAKKGGIREDFIFTNEDIMRPDITASQIRKSYENERILVKASHSVNIERIIDLLTKGDSPLA